MRLFILFGFLLIYPQNAFAQFDFLGAAQKIFTQTKPILIDGQETNNSTKTISNNLGSLTKTLSNRDIEGGLREALTLSATKVTKQLGSTNGFYNNPKIKIPLPAKLQTAHNMLSKIGLESLGNDLELKMNRAAEMAMPQAKQLFLASIKKMSVKDAQNILTGGDTAATQFFRNTMGADLIKAMRPSIDTQLANVNGMQTYNQLVKQYSNVPFAPKVNTDLTGYVANMAMNGIFTYMGREEAAIRANPVKQGSALLQKVFSAYR